MEAFLYAGAVFGMVLGASILPLRRKGAIEKWIMGSMLIFGAFATASITLQHQLSAFDRGGLLEVFEIGTGFAIGPLLYLFCKRRAGQTLSGRLAAAHFIPAATVTLLILAQGRYVFPISFMVAHQMAYTLLSVKFARVKSRTRDPWPWRLCGVALSIHVAQVLRMTFTDLALLRNVVPTTIIGGLALLALFSLRELLDSSLSVPPKASYERSGLDDETAKALEMRLSRVLEVDRPWLDPHLSLDRLAQRVDASPHHLSELLNGRLGSTFHEVVANERLEEAKRRLADPANDIFTIEAIAEGSGFPSRSSFYGAFRRRFGMTPTQFRRQARDSGD